MHTDRATRARTVPDTFDLADRAALAINGFGGTCDPAIDHLPFGMVQYARHPAHMDHWASADLGCGAKLWGGRPDPDRKRADDLGLPGHIAAPRPDPPYTAGAELGHWYSHFHARATVLRGLLEYARTVQDERILEFVRRSYEFTLSQGIPRIGWINCYPAATNMVDGLLHGQCLARAVLRVGRRGAGG